MIGRADMEGLKSNVAMNACAATQASYPCGLLEGQTGPKDRSKLGLRTHLTKPSGGVIHMSL